MAVSRNSNTWICCIVQVAEDLGFGTRTGAYLEMLRDNPGELVARAEECLAKMN